MQFFNKYKDGELIYGNLSIGSYFRVKGEFYGYYLKIDVGDGNYYAINLETGEPVIMSANTDIIPIDIKEVYYVNA